MANLADLPFSNPALLREALTHRSFGCPNNERLEFLGDSFLGLVVARALFERFPDYSEGQLSRLKGKIVRESTLAAAARRMDLGRHLRMGDGELKSGGSNRDSILADAFEALIGALGLDCGLDAVRNFVLEALADEFVYFPSEPTKDAKTALQELLQGRHQALPAYRTVRIEGREHEQSFTVECSVSGGDLTCLGVGRTRRAAEQEAAAKVLTLLQAES